MLVFLSRWCRPRRQVRRR